MTESKKVQLNTVFLGIIASLMLAAVPWTYSINGRLTRIETQLEMALDDRSAMVSIEHRLSECETDIAVLQNSKGE